jgi:hypothetical protein
MHCVSGLRFGLLVGTEREFRCVWEEAMPVYRSKPTLLQQQANCTAAAAEAKCKPWGTAEMAAFTLMNHSDLRLGIDVQRKRWMSL